MIASVAILKVVEWITLCTVFFVCRSFITEKKCNIFYVTEANNPPAWYAVGLPFFSANVIGGRIPGASRLTPHVAV